MKNLLITIISLSFFSFLHQCFSQPTDLSVQAFENFKKKTEAEIEKI